MADVNINQNALFVLKMPADGESYASLPSIDNFSFCGGNIFSISFNVYVKKGANGSVIEQKDSFSISIIDSQLMFESVNLGLLKFYLEEGLVTENEFNNFDITYDNSSLKIYVNAILCKEKNISGTAVYSQNRFVIGKGYNSYLSKFKIINYALTSEDVAKNSYENTIAKSALEACIDFSTSTPRDIGKNNLALNCEGFCIPKNIVKTLSVGEQGVVSPLKQPILSQKFSVLAKTYLTGCTGRDESIVSYGDYEQANSFYFGVSNDENPKAFVKIGNEKLVMTEPLVNYKWIDLSVTVDGKNVKIYLDGIEKAAKEFQQNVTAENLYIGNTVLNGRSQKNGFSGYIDSISLFDSPLKNESLKKMVSRPPFIFNENIIAIYSFCKNEPIELISSGMLKFSGNANIIVAENTVIAETIPPFEYDCTAKEPDLSDFELWSAATVLDMISEFMHTEHGLTPRYTEKSGGITNYPPALMAYASERIVQTDEAQLALSNYHSSTSKDIISLIATITVIGSVGVFAASLFKIGSVISSTAAAATASLAFAKAACAVAGVAAIGSVVAVIIIKITDNPPKPSRKKETDVFLISITFNHNINDTGTVSAINIKKSETKPLAIPEWRIDSPEKSYCSYVQSSLAVPQIEACFQYINTEYEPCTVKITGSADGLLGSFETSVTFPNPGTHTVKFSLNNNTIKTIAIGEKTERISWKCNFFNHLKFLGESVHTVFLVPQTPVSPYSISASEPDNQLHVDLLTFCGKAFGSNTKYNELQDKLGLYIRTHTGFTASKTDIYANLTGGINAGFKSENFFNDYNSGSASISSLDASVIFGLMSRANGCNSNIAVMESTLGKIRMSKDDGTIEYVQPVLFTNKVRALNKGNFAELEGMTAHYINTNEINPGFDSPVYDTYYTIDLGELGQIESRTLPFSSLDTDICMIDNASTYREAFFVTGVFVRITSIITNILKNPAPLLDSVQEQEELIFGNIGFSGAILTRDGNRPAWDTITNLNIPTTPDQDKCHSISYYHIQAWTVEIINNRNAAQPQPHANIIADLRGILNAVFVERTPPTGAIEKVAYDGAMGMLYNQSAAGGGQGPLFANLGAFGVYSQMLPLASAAWTFVRNLHNSLFNLRAANLSWNRSISSNFDPRGWVHYNAAGAMDNSDTGAVITWPLIATTANIPEPDVRSRVNGFYLYHPDDCTQIRLAFNADRNTRAIATMFTIKVNMLGTTNQNIRHTIYSSNNLLVKSTLTGKNNSDDLIHYYDGAVWQLL